MSGADIVLMYLWEMQCERKCKNHSTKDDAESEDDEE